MKIQYRIALIFSLITIGIAVAVSVSEYYFANQNIFEDFYKRLEIRAIVAAKARFEKEGMSKKAYEDIRARHLETLPHEQEYFISLQNLDESIAASGLQLPRSFYTQAKRNGVARYKLDETFYYGYRYTNNNQRYITVLSARNDYINIYFANMRTIMVVSILVTMIAALIIGLWFSKLMLKPVRVITGKVQDISASQLHMRLNVPKGRDEIAMLAETFNNMLDRLEASFETQKNFVSNASHELNTPLTTIIGESEYLLSKPRGQDEYVRSTEIILSEAERLKRITGSLLQLAQISYTGNPQQFSPLRIDELLYAVKAEVDNIISDNQVHINLSLIPEEQNKLVINGNEQLLELAFANIVINGCKYSGNQPVEVFIAATDKHVVVTIEDKGVGIPSSEIGLIYEPFFRASNSGKFHGYGIGLPLSRNIIRLHAGSLLVTSVENKGTTVKVKLPLATA